MTVHSASIKENYSVTKLFYEEMINKNRLAEKSTDIR